MTPPSHPAADALSNPTAASPSLYKHEFYQRIASENRISHASAIRDTEPQAWLIDYTTAVLRQLLAGVTPKQRWVTTFRKCFPFWWDKWSKEHPDLMRRLERENIWLFPLSKREKYIRVNGEDAYRKSKRLHSRAFREIHGLNHSVQLLSDAMGLLKKHEFQLDYEHIGADGCCSYCVECNGNGSHASGCALRLLFDKFEQYKSADKRTAP